MKTLRSKLYQKSLLTTSIASAVVALIFTTAYIWLTERNFQHEVTDYSNEVTTILTESLREAVRYSNISDINKSIGYFGKSTIKWIIIYDSDKIPIYTNGNAPDAMTISQYQHNGWNQKKDEYIILGKITEGSHNFGEFKVGLNLDKKVQDLSIKRNETILIVILAFIFTLISISYVLNTLLIRINKLHAFINSYPNAPKDVPDKTNDEISDIRTAFINASSLLVQKERLIAENAHLAALGELAAAMSHDIRSPISAMNIAIRSDSITTPEGRSILESSMKRINDVASDLLSKFKTKSNPLIRHNTEFTEVNLITKDVNLIVKNIFEEKAILLRSQSKCSFSIDFNMNVPAFSSVDEAVLTRVISNVIDNAIDAVDERDGSIVVAVRTTVDNVSILVSDNGDGIPPDILNILGTEPLTFNKNKGEGNGLGIYLGKKMIESMSGSLSIQSKVKTGTLVTISFPRYRR